MGIRTPNIDRIASEGVTFTDYDGEQSCTAGRASFITGQNPYRTGLTKVGMPGTPIGLQADLGWCFGRPSDSVQNGVPTRDFVEPRVGIEPTTYALRVRCSTD